MENLDETRKKLLWRATHRGIKEMDLIVGGYAHKYLATMGLAELQEFAAILELPDQDMLEWATRQADIPPEKATPLLHRMLFSEDRQ